MISLVTPKTLSEAAIRKLHDETVAKIRSMTTTSTTYDAYFQLTSLQYHCRVALGEKRAHRGSSREKSRQRVCDEINNRTRQDRIRALHCLECHDVLTGKPKQEPCGCHCHGDKP